MPSAQCAPKSTAHEKIPTFLKPLFGNIFEKLATEKWLKIHRSDKTGISPIFLDRHIQRYFFTIGENNCSYAVEYKAPWACEKVDFKWNRGSALTKSTVVQAEKAKGTAMRRKADFSAEK